MSESVTSERVSTDAEPADPKAVWEAPDVRSLEAPDVEGGVGGVPEAFHMTTSENGAVS